MDRGFRMHALRILECGGIKPMMRERSKN